MPSPAAQHAALQGCIPPWEEGEECLALIPRRPEPCQIPLSSMAAGPACPRPSHAKQGILQQGPCSWQPAPGRAPSTTALQGRTLLTPLLLQARLPPKSMHGPRQKCSMLLSRSVFGDPWYKATPKLPPALACMGNGQSRVLWGFKA